MNDELKPQAMSDRSVTPHEDASGHRPSSVVYRLIEGRDFYREGALIVFTTLYHLRRGYCCGSGCRHCPYDAEECADASGGVEESPRRSRGERPV